MSPQQNPVQETGKLLARAVCAAQGGSEGAVPCSEEAGRCSVGFWGAAQQPVPTVRGHEPADAAPVGQQGVTPRGQMPCVTPALCSCFTGSVMVGVPSALVTGLSTWEISGAASSVSPCPWKCSAQLQCQVRSEACPVLTCKLSKCSQEVIEG